MDERFDYIVIGGGSAGAVIAARLSERPEVRVLLLEAGKPDRSILLEMPLAFRMLRQRMLYDWGYQSEPEPFADGRRIPAARGKVLGGSSSINGMMYSRGHPSDFDRWARLGATGWAYEDVLPYFRKSENSQRGASRWHGVGGPLQVTTASRQAQQADPIVSAFQAAARQRGDIVTDDLDGEVPEGFTVADRTVGKGRRSSTSRAFLDPARHRANLVIRTDAHVTRIVIEGHRAVGVEARIADAHHSIRADAEVVLCGGTYASPQLLMLSGIGPADHLRQTGIAVIADRPGVGSGLKEHPLVPMGFGGRRAFPMRRKLRADQIALAAIQWKLTGKGTIASEPLSSYAFYRSRTGLEAPDLENIMIPISLQARVWFPGFRKPPPDMMTSLNCVLHPGSTGSVRLRSSDPFDKPVIRFNLLADPDDLARLRYSIGWTRELMRTAPISDWVGDELFPGPKVDGIEAMNAYIRSTVVTEQHPTSTCRMGTDADSVVDAELRVHGIDGLRVADASIMPTPIGGHTNAAAIMIGERAADLILAGRSANRSSAPAAQPLPVTAQ